jgi:hypothetical protein
MNIIEHNNTKIESGDIVVTYDNEKYLVIYEKTCIAWHFVNIEHFEFNIEEDTVDVQPQIGYKIDGIGKIVSVIKTQNINLSF